MSKRYDATVKHLLDAYPDDWTCYVGLAGRPRVEAVDVDLSTVTRKPTRSSASVAAGLGCCTWSYKPAVIDNSRDVSCDKMSSWKPGTICLCKAL